MPGEARPHILVVDDDPAVQEALTAALEGTYVVHAAATGEAACAILRTRPIAGIILDVMLGAEHGLDLVDRFRALSAAPILILTAHSTEDLAIRAVWAKVDGYRKKPMSLDELREAVARLVARPETPPDPLARVRRHLDTHLGDEVDLEGLARQVHWSEGHLDRRFHESYGRTPRRYLTEARLRHAATLLQSTGRDVADIAQSLRFANVQRFRRLFFRHFGLTPSAYRVNHLGPGNGDYAGPGPRVEN